MRVLQGAVTVGCVVALAACGPSEPASGGGTPGAPTGVGATDSLDEETADTLARRYLRCVNAAGFELEDAWVHRFSGTGLLVKTAVDVPAPVHGPCLVSIGGPRTDLSSWSL